MTFISKISSALVVFSLLFSPVLAQEATETPSPEPGAAVAEMATSTPLIPEVPVTEASTTTVAEPTPILTASSTEDTTQPIPEEPEPVIPEGAPYVPGEVIVKFKESRIDLADEDDAPKVGAFAEAKDVEVVDELTPANIVVVETEGSIVRTAAALEKDPSVEFAEPNYLYATEGGGTDATDEHFDTLWAFRNTGQEVGPSGNTVTGVPDADLDVPEAWELSRGQDVLVAVVDSGVAYDHPDLAANMWDGTDCLVGTTTPVVPLGGCTHGYDFYRDNADPLPQSDHGTHVAGTIAAIADTDGVVGIAPAAKIMALRTDVNGTDLSVSAIVDAIDFARVNGARIINASFGGPGESIALHDAIARFGAADGLFVASAGNDASDIDSPGDETYPAAFDLDNILAVAATTEDDALDTGFSNYGATSVDVGAPGTRIASTGFGATAASPTYEYKQGTSMAAPHVSGLAALLLAYDPTLTVAELKAAIIDTGDALPTLASTTVSGKRVNAFAALASVATTSVAGTLEVVTQVVNDNGRTATPDAFGFKLDGGRTRMSEASGTTTLTLAPGSYLFTEVGAADYTLTSTACSNLTLSIGSTTTCTMIYDDTVPVISPPSSGGGGGGGGGGSKKKSKAQKEKELAKKKAAAEKKKAEAAKKKAALEKKKAEEAARAAKKGKKEVVAKGSATPKPLAPPLAYASFARDLGMGASGQDVTELQKLLAARGFLLVAPTGYFGPATQAALVKYQIANSISPASGFAGPLTRAALNAGK